MLSIVCLGRTESYTQGSGIILSNTRLGVHVTIENNRKSRQTKVKCAQDENLKCFFIITPLMAELLKRSKMF